MFNCLLDLAVHLHTVRCRNDPVLADDASAAEVTVSVVDILHADLPGPGVRSCRRTPTMRVNVGVIAGIPHWGPININKCLSFWGRHLGVSP